MNKIRFDPWLTLTIVLLMGTGMIMVFSASSIESLEATKHETMYLFMKKQAINYGLGIAAGLLVALFPYKKLRNHITLLNLVAIVLLLLILSPLGMEVNGATRWINIGMTFQPSEFAKVVVILTMAHLLSNFKRWGTLNRVGSLGVLALYLLFYGALIGVPQNHASVVMILFLVAGTMMFYAGLSRKIVAVAVLAGGAVAALVIFTSEFRMKRVLTFMDPLHDKMGEGFQITQNWFALGSGEFWGLGLGMSRQKFGWLPEAHTDFILSVIGEELGFKGVLFIIALFLMFIVRSAFIALKTEDDFGVLIVSGFAVLVFYQAAINMAVISGLFPVTGIPLPFISYGGTSTIIFCIGVGLIYSVLSENERTEKEKKET